MLGDGHDPHIPIDVANKAKKKKRVHPVHECVGINRHWVIENRTRPGESSV